MFVNNENPHNEDVAYLREHFSEAEVIRSDTNTGFSKGHNILVREAKKRGAHFYGALNCDITLPQNFISELLNPMLANPKVASASGKIKKWHFESNTHTNFIDSAGLVISREHRFANRGEGEIDHGQYDREEEVFGVSGTAALYRTSSLEDIAFTNERGEKEYFDELMFMYKEDIDLAYRLQWAGYDSMYVPSAVAYHDRTLASAGNGLLDIVRGRFGRDKQAKSWSWLNHHIILSKYLDSDYSAETKAQTFWYEVKSLGFVLFFEPYLLKEFVTFLKIRKQIRARKRQLKRRVANYSLIERWMEG